MKIEYYLENTMLQILKTKMIDDIRVAEIIDEIGICKGTFYKYYRDKFDLLQRSFDNFYYNDIKVKSEDFETFIHNLLETAICNREIFVNAFQSDDINNIKNYNSALIKSYIDQENLKRGRDITRENYKYVSEIYSDEITQIILNWLKNGMWKNPDKMEEIIFLMYPPLLAE